MLERNDSYSNSASPPSDDPILMDTTIPQQLGVAPSPLSERKKKSNSDSRKQLRQNGKEYFTAKGKYCGEKKIRIISCSCTYKCKEININERRSIFKRFWELGNWQCQSNFIISCVNLVKPKRSYVNNSRKTITREFMLNGKRVCKNVFLATLGISNKRLDYVLRKKCSNNMCSPDKRGKMTSGNKTKVEHHELVINFLDVIPKYSSHYTNSDKKYFSPDLSIPKLFDLYCHWCRKEKKCSMIVSKNIFNKIFKSYNIGIYVPRTDTCKTCDQFQVELGRSTIDENEKNLILINKNSHHARATFVRDKLNTATALSKVTGSLLVFTFDMEKTQPFPKMNTSVVFYKRQMWMYNLGIHTCHDSQGYMCMWTENQGKRGANEVCSSIYKFINTIDHTKYEKILTFSDACGGQNRNKLVITFMMWICDNYNFESWEHFFLESGHSYLPNDRDFAHIEKKMKKETCIYHPDQMFEIVQKSRVTQPYKVIPMENNFFDFTEIKNARKFDNQKTDFDFRRLKSFFVNRHSDQITFKRGDSETTFEFICQKKRNVPTPQSQTEPPKISKPKYDDVMSLLNLIPPEYHQYYTSLQHE